MTNLENEIMAFDDWSHPKSFFKSISEKLPQDDSELFKEIWKTANDTEIWGVHDQILSCRITQTLIRNTYGLDDSATAKIVRAITHYWK